jgi:protein phosphatase
MSKSYSDADSEIKVPREFYFISNRSLPFFTDEMHLARSMLENERKVGYINNGIVRGPLIKLKVPDELVVIGDLHGDIESLLAILHSISFKQFLSNPNNKLIFLGDYIDRGSDSVCVLQTVFYLKRKYPDSVILMCGNHEAIDRFYCSAHNLPEELQQRYGLESSSIYEELFSLFKLLPKVVIVEDQLLITHGGLPAAINESDFLDMVIKDDNDITEELLWNDPRSDIPDNQDWCKSRRGFGKHFGINITKKYLAFTQTKALLRSHEPCHGFRIDHDNLVLTLFSSKESYQKFDAAYIFITKEELKQITNASDLAKYVKKI